ncbi:D-mannose binding lectin protein with Apple-like carbohydrate-binding domain [Euphorbia peplus]|nr:D-mannose binding lectin protein with Apple-like carbohydrate-binding domain [Euphorbia peplus]
MGWSESCEIEKLSSCEVNEFRYYKIQGVDHFSAKYSDGGGVVKIGTCRDKCTNDCKCLGYFYNSEESRCWIAYDLNTLTKVENSTHLGFIKAPTKKALIGDLKFAAL